jgi:polyhydroxyalkanoate synthesis regulator phasin
MAGLGDFVQKAFYLGVGAASYAAEKAGGKLAGLRVQAQKLADEMVARGEITAEDAKRIVDEMMNRAQQEQPSVNEPRPTEPRRIEILTDDEPEPAADAASETKTAGPESNVDDLRAQVAKLQEELRRLKRE